MLIRRARCRRFFILMAAFCGFAAVPHDPGVLADEAIEAKRLASIQRGAQYLLAQCLNEDGSYARELGPAATALATAALLRTGTSPSDARIQRSLQHLRGFVRSDGGIYIENSLYQNYETCIALMCFHEAQQRAGDQRFQTVIDGGLAFVKQQQWDSDEGVSQADPAFGGSGYGKHERPDLSNASYLVDTLTQLGADADDEAIQRALVFVSRCQNLESSHNLTPFATKNPDGGFYYTPAAGGSSQAGSTDTGGLRSYGSMTYAGLKSMLHAGVGPDDPRVRAARSWIGQHYTLIRNPGLGQQGLFYYYHTFAKTLATLGEPELVDGDGKRHMWKHDLIEELARRQRPDGSWINAQPRWYEDNPVLVTGYALLALSYCQPN